MNQLRKNHLALVHPSPLRRCTSHGRGTCIQHSRGETTLIFFRDKVSPEVEEDIRYVKDALGIEQKDKEIPLTSGLRYHYGGEITPATRSMWEILSELSVGVEVPEQVAAEGRATATPRPRGRPISLPAARIHASSERPANAYIAAHYRDQWFWVERRDFGSKRIVTFLMVFSSIAETWTVLQVSIITIPAN